MSGRRCRCGSRVLWRPLHCRDDVEDDGKGEYDDDGRRIVACCGWGLLRFVMFCLVWPLLSLPSLLTAAYITRFLFAWGARFCLRVSAAREEGVCDGVADGDGGGASSTSVCGLGGRRYDRVSMCGRMVSDVDALGVWPRVFVFGVAIVGVSAATDLTIFGTVSLGFWLMNLLVGVDWVLVVPFIPIVLLVLKVSISKEAKGFVFLPLGLYFMAYFLRCCEEVFACHGGSIGGMVRFISSKAFCGVRQSFLCHLVFAEDSLKGYHLFRSCGFASFIFWMPLSLQLWFFLACLIEVDLSSFEVKIDIVGGNLSLLEVDFGSTMEVGICCWMTVGTMFLDYVGSEDGLLFGLSPLSPIERVVKSLLNPPIMLRGPGKALFHLVFLGTF
ncbi:hypothetical protein SUGI_1121500 [Cryptomeria japonica]|nr:hypothetical protein SUGI_1121500 [Cryptomeria japonica]